MNPIETQIECATCTWNKYCIEPPVMTKKEVEEKTKTPSKKALTQKIAARE